MHLSHSQYGTTGDACSEEEDAEDLASKYGISESLLCSLGLSLSGIAYVVNTANSPPSRKVGRKRRRNLILEVPMRRFPVVLQAESLTGEFPFLLEMDRRNDVRMIFDQPIQLKVEIQDRLGRRTRTTYTADYLVLYESKVCAVEIKADSDLETLNQDRPNDWILDEEGYKYLPAVRRFAEMGIEHTVVPISSLSSLRADNLRYLATTRGVIDTRKYRKAREGIRHLLRDEPTMLMTEILEHLGDEDTTPILQLIESEEIFVDLDRVTLSDPRSVWISTSLDMAKIAQESCTALKELLVTSDLSANDIADPKYHLEIATRLSILQGVTRKNRHGKEVCERTMRRYRAAFQQGDNDLTFITPKWSNCGNTNPRVGEVHYTYIEACIRKGKSDANDSSISACYDEYCENFQQAKDIFSFFDENPICRSSFYNYWHRTPLRNQDSHSKGGRRLENEQADSLNPLTKTILATRPFAVAHIDHWKTDIHLVVGYVNDVKITKRAWLTAMVDAFSGKVLAIWLSYDDPSKKACTMVIRDCVRRHGRLPEMLIVDGGSDFKSAHFFVMLATLRVIRCERPPEDPRFGKEVERLFKHFKERFVRGLPGYGISIERSRAVSAAFKAPRKSTLTLMDAFEALEAFVFKGYNNQLKPGETSSREAIEEKGLRRYPHSGQQTSWDLKFLIATSIEPPDSGYKLWSGRGLHINDKWFTSPRLMSYRGYKKDLSIRVEPYADSIIYVCIDGKWLVCANSEAPLQFAMSERSLTFLSSERRDLAALREELTNEMNRCVAKIVNEKLHEIAARKESSPNKAVATDQSLADPNVSGKIPFNFDDIEPYESDPL